MSGRRTVGMVAAALTIGITIGTWHDDALSGIQPTATFERPSDILAGPTSTPPRPSDILASDDRDQDNRIDALETRVTRLEATP